LGPQKLVYHNNYIGCWGWGGGLGKIKRINLSSPKLYWMYISPHQTVRYPWEYFFLFTTLFFDFQNIGHPEINQKYYWISPLTILNYNLLKFEKNMYYFLKKRYSLFKNIEIQYNECCYTGALLCGKWVNMDSRGEKGEGFVWNG